MKAIIFLNGTAPSQELLSNIDASCPLVICADGAYAYVKDKIAPTVVLGDFDSFPKESVHSGIDTVVFPPEKDYTDGHIAVAYALERGADEIEIYGAFGGRPDHEYSNLSLLYFTLKNGAKATMISDEWIVTIEDGTFDKTVKKGATVSLVPFLATSHILLTEGLKYPMREVTLDRLHILGISNVALESKIKVSCRGELLVFIQNV